MNESSEINGILNILKPPGMTSHDVINFVRRALKLKKAGHSGTLDPGVAGVLPVFLGKATKIIEYMSDDTKQYRAEITFGRSTDTQDSFGQTIRSSDASRLTEEQVLQVMTSFRGQQDQVPPMVSAVKVEGRRLYQLARMGIEIERKPRPVHIHEIAVLKYSGFHTPTPQVLFDIKCSKGTYVRTICNDMGERLGCGGFMSFLVRTKAGRFHLDKALTLEEISRLSTNGEITKELVPVHEALAFEQVTVYDDVVSSVMHGNRVYLPGVDKMPEYLEEKQLVKLMNKNKGCLAVARVLYDRAKAEGSPAKCHRYIFQPIKVLC